MDRFSKEDLDETGHEIWRCALEGCRMWGLKDAGMGGMEELGDFQCPIGAPLGRTCAPSKALGCRTPSWN